MVQFDRLKVTELTEACKIRGLSHAGLKAQLIERLNHHELRKGERIKIQHASSFNEFSPAGASMDAGQFGKRKHAEVTTSEEQLHSGAVRTWNVDLFQQLVMRVRHCSPTLGQDKIKKVIRDEVNKTVDGLEGVTSKDINEEMKRQRLADGWRPGPPEPPDTQPLCTWITEQRRWHMSWNTSGPVDTRVKFGVKPPLFKPPTLPAQLPMVSKRERFQLLTPDNNPPPMALVAPLLDRREAEAG